MSAIERPPLAFTVDGRPVEVPDAGATLLDVLRERLGLRSPKDGCSPQGQCGCCTVLVDGRPRVACVTPARRVRGRAITTLDGLDEHERARWGDAFCAAGASQCGFCTPGIVMRLAGLRAKGAGPGDEAAVEQALLAHLCRCTGWRTILDAWRLAARGDMADGVRPSAAPGEAPTATARDLDRAAQRATIEGRTPQRVGPDVALGRGGFADDRAPRGALLAVPDGHGGWATGETLAEARTAAGKVQGRRTTAEPRHPVEVPPGLWDLTLRTTWVEPAYLELDASWCLPGGEPASPLANGGAFGGKLASVVTGAARELADRHGRPVRVVLTREDAVRLGAKRPPIAAGVRADGTGAIRVARTPGIAAAIASVAPGLTVEEVDVAGPSTSAGIRAAGWAEALTLLAGASAVGASPPGVRAAGTGPGAGASGATGAGPWARVTLTSPDGATADATVRLDEEPRVSVRLACGDPLDDVALRSYCVGAAHMGLGWVCSEGLAVDESGEVHDLTIRSFGVLRAVDMPPVDVEIAPQDGPPLNGSDAVFAAVAAAAWLAQGMPPAWPTGTLPR